MKIEKQKSESFYILGYLLELIIKIWQFGNTILPNLANLGGSFFSMKCPSNRSKTHFSGQNLAKVCPQKYTLVTSEASNYNLGPL
jgi:hypothetical protein